MDHRRREKKERKEKKQQLRAQALAKAADDALGGRELRAQTLTKATNNAPHGRELCAQAPATAVGGALVDHELRARAGAFRFRSIDPHEIVDMTRFPRFHTRVFPAIRPFVPKHTPYGLGALSCKSIDLTPDQCANQGEIVVTRDFAWTFGCNPCVGFCLHATDENSESIAIAGRIDPSSNEVTISELLETIIPLTATVQFAIFSGIPGRDFFIDMMLYQLRALKCKSSTIVVQAIGVKESMAVDAQGTFYHVNPNPGVPDVVDWKTELRARPKHDVCIPMHLIDRCK